MKFDEYVKMTKERDRDVTAVFKDRGVDLDIWCVCFPKWYLLVSGISVLNSSLFYSVIVNLASGSA